MTDPSPKPVALTVGDPAGIGPELTLKTLADPAITELGVLVVGAAPLLARVADHLGLPTRVVPVTDTSQVGHEPGVAYVLDVGDLDPATVVPGAVAPACGQASVDAIRAATELALDGAVCAVASAPANKEAMNAAGHSYAGQTEIFADLTGTSQFHTVLVGGPLRVSLVTSHCSMREVLDRITTDRVEEVLRQLHAAMRDVFDMPEPRIGVAGLNPHAGENGVLGREELDHIVPAVRACRADGIAATDPLSADSLFAAAEVGHYDAVLAMYHDQGVIPLKRYGYVTYAAGLPIVRTTCGHGTAFDIAWHGKADPDLLIRAVQLAGQLGRARKRA